MVEILGSFNLVLHAHLPWVIGHGVWPHGMDWINEAAAETYIPLLMELYKLVDDGYSPKLTVGLTPVLCEMLRNPRFIDAFIGYLDEKYNAAVFDFEDFTKKKYEDGRIKLTEWWQEFYSRVKDNFIHRYNRDIVGAFKDLQDKGFLDIITCGATHGYAPLLSKETSIDAQFKTAVDSYKRHFGRAPTGAWLCC